jgi:CTP synthase
LKFSGNSPDRNFVEIAELPEHPWYLGCQFHPEFKSKPLQPHPLFASFIEAAYRHRKERITNKKVSSKVKTQKSIVEA